MKKILMTLAAVLCCTMTMTVFTACSVEDNSITAPAYEQQDVTILFYGHGGGTLDAFLINNIRQLYKARRSCYDNVKVVVEYKFSSKDNLPHFDSDEAEKEFLSNVELMGEDTINDSINSEDYVRWMNPEGYSTFRFILDPDQNLHQQAAASYLPDPNCDITCPDSLTNFISWAVKACPAKHYVLILSDHGSGYTPDDEIFDEDSQKGMTRGVIYDFGNNLHHFTAKSLANAIKASGIRPGAIYFDACLMNTLEYQFELKDVTDYIVASTYVVPGAGGLYDALLEWLSRASGNLEYGLKKYIEIATKNWDIDDFPLPLYNDLTVSSTAGFNQLGIAMREFTDRLCYTYQNGTAEQRQKIDNVTKNAVKTSNNNPSYDAAKYMASIMRALPEVYDDAFYDQLATAFNNCIVDQATSKYLRERNYQVDFSVMLATKGTYKYAYWDQTENETGTAFIYTLTKVQDYHADGTTTTYDVNNGLFSNTGEADYTLEYKDKGHWGGTLESTYGRLAFDQATGWSRWLMLNEQEPQIWSRNDFFADLPEGDLSEDTSKK